MEQKKRVLVVEDEAAIARLVGLIITSLGCLVDTASNGAEGLLRVEENKPDLCIVDLIMPVMTGEEFIQELQGRPEWADIPIVLLTTRGSAKGYKRDEFPLISKPFEPDAVRDMVRRVLNLS
jgi:CheY-like chemotaxis protein